MNRKTTALFLVVITLLSVGFLINKKGLKVDDDRFVSCIVNPNQQNTAFYWKDEKNENFRSLLNLKLWMEKHHQKLLFAMNAGMYKKDHTPQGLFIEKQIIRSEIDTANGKGNFYLKPNGIFYLTIDNTPVICKTAQFIQSKKVKYATQSGPMLVINGKIHDAFAANSTNLNIRNGVGILPNNKLLFAMSKKEINFYDFADYFRKMGCKNALYLDGFVSRTYLPEKKWIQTDGDFGVMIGVTE